MNVNWCTSCKCVLANEEVVNGVCERCGSEVVHKVKSQWMLKITEYADRLINDLDLVNYPDRVKAQQKNWIGRSKGAEVDFTTTTGDTLTIYTTRADTLYGATYMVIATGTSSTHVKALADEVEYKLDQAGISVSHIEGYRSNSWILLDYIDVIVNVFDDEARDFYDLERLWQDGESVDLTGIID